MEDNIPSKWNVKASRNSYTNIWQRLQLKLGAREHHHILVKGTDQAQ
jgi:hypothetical protein